MTIVKHIAHRGCIDIENTIEGITEAAESFDMVEVDVRYNSERVVVLCHDREKRNEINEPLATLCQISTPMRLMLDIKAFGIQSAQKLARDVVFCVSQHPQHEYELCSFNEYCVQELIEQRIVSRSYLIPHTYRIGVIASGIPMGMFGHMPDIDFISLNYDIVHEEIIEKCRDSRNGKKAIYAWTCNDENVKHDMIYRYKLEGIIYDQKSLWKKIEANL